LYQGTVAAPAAGAYSCIFITYSDAGHTTLVGNIERVSDHLRVVPPVAESVWSEPLPGAFGAGEAGQILGDNLDDLISTRSAPGDLMGLDATAIDGIWDEALAGHLGAGTTGKALDDASAGGSTPAAIATAVWAESLPGAFGVNEAGKIVGDNVDAAISSRSTLVQADILNDGTPFAGADIASTLADTAAIEPLVVLNLDATVSSRATQAQILSDATPFPGADIDVAISTRSSHTAADVDALVTVSHGAGSYQTATGFAVAGDSMNLNSAAIDLIWDELIAGHLGVGSVGEALSDASSGAGVDWTVSERSQMRKALGITGATLATAAGELQDVLADTAAMQPLVDAAISTRSTLVQTDILSDSVPFPGADIDAAISSRSSHTAADVDALVTVSHGAGSYQTAAGFAVAGDAMALTGPAVSGAVDAVWDEVLAGHLAAGTTGKALDDASAGSSPAAVSAAVWAEALPGAFGAGEAGKIIGDNVDAAISSRGTADPGDSMDLIPAATAAVVAAVDVQLSGSHGAGSWESDSDTDWTASEKEEIRGALGVTGATSVPAGGQLQDILADTSTNLDATISSRAAPGDLMGLDPAAIDAIWSEVITPHIGPGSAGQALLMALGNAGGQVRDDALTYDANDRPLTLRRRIFPDAATANASTPGATGEGELVTVTISATHVDAAQWSTLLRTI